MEDLFGAHKLAGLSYAPDLLTPQQERDLPEAIDASGLSPFRFQQWTGKQLTRSFGWSYDFTTGSFMRADPLPEWLLPVRHAAAAFADLPADNLEQALVIRYDPGAGIGWHRDRPVFEHVVGVSIGAMVPMRFRQRVGPRFERRQVELASRSVYHLSGEARHGWEHSIAPVNVPRWSITFRSLAAPRPAQI